MARRSTVKGAARLKRTLRKLPDAIKGQVVAVIAEAAEEIHFEALSAYQASPHPYATGNLVGKIRYEIAKDGLSARIGSFGSRRQRAPHVHLVEFGVSPHPIPMPGGGVIQHPGHAPTPFLFPAHKKVRDRFRLDIGEAVRNALHDVAKQQGPIE